MKSIEEEINQAKQKYGHFNSTHEVYGVLIEEVEEFFDVVRLKPIEHCDPKSQLMINELTQIAAIAQRAIKELENNQIKWV